MQDKKYLESLFQMVHGLKRQLHDKVEQLDAGIAPMQVRVLKIIDRTTPCSAVDIAHMLHRDKAQVTRLLNTLIEQGLITKQPNPNDKRSQCLALTERSLQLMCELSVIDKQIHEQMTQGLTAEELVLFEKVSAKIISNLSL